MATKKKIENKYYVLSNNCEVIYGRDSLENCKNFIYEEDDDEKEEYEIVQVVLRPKVTPAIITWEKS